MAVESSLLVGLDHVAPTARTRPSLAAMSLTLPWSTGASGAVVQVAPSLVDQMPILGRLPSWFTPAAIS
jgi:hypothetical protein